jgi:hypothetical protein
MNFLLAFLGALFAIVVSLVIVYTYMKHRFVPKLMSGLRAFVKEIGPRAVFERANLDPTEAMRQLGVTPAEAAAAIAAQRAAALGTDGTSPSAVRIIYTCEDHGRCVGCPKVLAQFEAILRHQGEDSFDEVEKKCYAQLCEQLAIDALLPGESEAERQKRIAARVVEALVCEGFASNRARGVVWTIGKDARATFAAWLSAARESCVDASDEGRVS